MSTSQTLEPVNILYHITKGILQMRLRTLTQKDYFGLSMWAREIKKVIIKGRQEYQSEKQI